MDRCVKADGQVHACLTQQLERLFARELLPSLPWVVPEQPRRNQAGSRLRKAAEGSPNEIVRPHNSGECTPNQQVLSHGSCARVKHDEISVFAWSLDQSAAEAWLPQQLFQMLRRQVAGQVKVARQQARGNCGCTQTETELNFLKRGRSPLPIVIAAFQNDSPWLV